MLGQVVESNYPVYVWSWMVVCVGKSPDAEGGSAETETKLLIQVSLKGGTAAHHGADDSTSSPDSVGVSSAASNGKKHVGTGILAQDVKLLVAREDGTVLVLYGLWGLAAMVLILMLIIGLPEGTFGITHASHTGHEH